jgi:hypothetical protein
MTTSGFFWLVVAALLFGLVACSVSLKFEVGPEDVTPYFSGK